MLRHEARTKPVRSGEARSCAEAIRTGGTHLTDDADALYRPIHFSGLELGVSAAWAALLKQPTGAPTCFSADVAAIAKRDLKAGETLDGEGGFCVRGRQVPAAVSLREGYLPLGLAQNVALTRDVAAGSGIRWADVAFDPDDAVVRLRREMEAAFAPARSSAATS